jgi:hypothetical protein
MMECKVIREKLSAFLEGAISPEEKRLIGEHLPTCQDCSNALEDLKKTEALLKGLEEVEPPAWLKQKVMARIRAEEEARKSILHKLFYPLHVKIPIEAFATVLIAVAAIYIFKAVEPEMKRAPSLSSGPVALAPGEKAIPKKDLSSDAKGEQARSEHKRDRVVITEGKKSVVAEVKEGELKTEPSKPLQGEPPSEPMLAKKEASIERRREKVAKAAESPEPKPSLSQPPSLGPPTKQEEIMVSKGGGKEMMWKLGATGHPVSVDVQKKAGLMGITIHVMDVKMASEKTENILGQLGAQKIEIKSLQSTEVISAELQAEKIKDLFEKLASIGEVKEKGVPSDIAKGDTGIRIEIVPND